MESDSPLPDRRAASNNVLLGREGSYAVLEVIGKGAYGTVYKGIWREVGRHVAIKRVSRSRLSSDEEKALQTEIHLFKNLKDKHIVNYIEAVDNPRSAYLDIVMEYVEGGSLYSIVQSIRRSLEKGARVFDEVVVADFIRQVVLGLRYLHRQGVVHRDIKGANILVTKESHVKLTDFGVASTKPGSDLSPSNPIDVAGSPYWMAPEIISLTGSSTASDIWSLGCTVIELITGFPPYHDLSGVTALFRIVSDECPPLPPNLSSDCEDFLRKCFNKDMHTRASADELLLHRWLGQVQEIEKDDEQGEVLEKEIPSSLANGMKGNSSSFQQGGHSESVGNIQVSLGMYEEADDETFDDLDFSEEEGFDQGNGKETSSLEFDSSFSSMKPSGRSLDDRNGRDESIGSALDENIRRMSIRDDPFQDIMEDPEADMEREHIRKQKELWELVKLQAAALGQDEKAQIAACDALVEMFRANPEQRYYLIYDPGLLPIIEVLESGGNGNMRVIEAILRVTLSLLDEPSGESGKDLDNNVATGSGDIASFGYPRVSNIREDLCLAGFLPVVMRYCYRRSSLEARLLSGRFLERMLEMEFALHMFIACRGFAVFVEMLEPDIISASDLARIALGGIEKMLSMENQRHRRDFCRRFAYVGLLERITDGISYNMNCVQTMAESSSLRLKLEAHVTKLAKLLQTFAARADPMVKVKMITKCVLHPIIAQITNMQFPDSALQSILCCVRDLSRDPQTHLALQDASAIETLVQYLSVEQCSQSGQAKHFIISSLHNLCIVSPGRQEAAARAGIVPHLQRYIRLQDINLRSLCIDMYSGLACAGHLTRLELSKHGGVDFYIELLELLSVPGTVRKWQARVLQSISEWLDDSHESSRVEERLVANCKRVCDSLALMRVLDVEGVLEPYLKMVTISERVNIVFGAMEEWVSALVRWLERMYVDGGDKVGGPRGRLLLLRTLLAHARVWKKGTESSGIARALSMLLTEVVLVCDEAITVREQASLLLAALSKVA